jgi:hypothetical protein
MAARGTVHLRLPGGARMLARTDLTGNGIVYEGTEFVARELWPNEDRLIRDGRKLRVRVKAVERVSRSYHVLDVEVLEDLTPERAEPGELF